MKTNYLMTRLKTVKTGIFKNFKISFAVLIKLLIWEIITEPLVIVLKLNVYSKNCDFVIS